MPWVRFTADFDFKPTPQVTVAHKQDSVAMVPTECAKAAVSAGKAERTSKPGAEHGE